MYKVTTHNLISSFPSENKYNFVPILGIYNAKGMHSDIPHAHSNNMSYIIHKHP